MNYDDNLYSAKKGQTPLKIDLLMFMIMFLTDGTKYVKRIVIIYWQGHNCRCKNELYYIISTSRACMSTFNLLDV